MKSGSSALQDFLRLRQPHYVRELFTILLADGVTTLLYTDCDIPLSYGGTTWAALGQLISRTRLTMRGTTEIPEVDVTVSSPDTAAVNGLSFKLAAHNGILDGARITVSRVFMPIMGDTSLGLVNMFEGRLGQAVISADGVKFTCKGDNVLMNQQVPRNLYQTTCLHTFCDSGCTLLKANFSTPNTAAFGATTTKIPWGTPPANPALYVLGEIVFNAAGAGGGVCAGQTATIRNADATYIYLTYPLYGTPEQGDQFTAIMGCARTLGVCRTHTDNTGATVDNSANFRGYPFVPQVEYGI